MPPKKGRGTATRRSDETQRLPGEERGANTTTAATSALNSRPHHLVSRLHPHWNAPGSTAANSSSHPPLHPAKAAVAAAAKTAPLARGRDALPTRIAGRSGAAAAAAATAVRDSRKPANRTTAGTSRAAVQRKGTSSNITAAIGNKRSRSRSASTPIEVDAEASPPDVEDSSVGEMDDSSSSSEEEEEVSASSSPSLSPPAVLAESKVLHSAAKLKSAVEEPGGGGDACPATPSRTHHGTSIAASTAVEAGRMAGPLPTGEVSPQQWPPAHTANSTAESKALLGDDDDDDESYAGRWASESGVERGKRGKTCAATAATREGHGAPSGGLSPLPEHQQETHMLGELSDRGSITPARPARVAPQRLPPNETAEKETAGDESELLGDILCSSVNGGVAYRGTQGRVDRQIIGDEMTNLTASTGPATPSLQPTLGGVSPAPLDRSPEELMSTPGVMAANAAAVAVRFTETLAVQDLSLLTEESGPATPYARGDGAATLLSSSKKAAPAKEGEVLLGDGLLSPPAKRVTATPQQAALRAEAIVQPGAVAAKAEHQNGGVPNAQRELRAPPPLFKGLSASSSSTTATTTTASLLTPHTPVEDATAAGGEGEATADVPASHSSPTDDSDGEPPLPNVGSLPSTLDDGCWKEDEQTPLQTPPTSHLRPSDDADGTDFRLALNGGAAQAQETVPIDPFLVTPPRFRHGNGVVHTEVLSEDSDAVATPDRHNHAAVLAAAHATGRQDEENRRSSKRGSGRGGRAASKSVTPPRNAKPHSVAEVDPAALKVGTAVEGRWGRQWFPAVVSEAPRNGFVQIKWTEDASLLHVRLREVRLPQLPIVDAAAAASGPEADNAAKRSKDVATRTATPTDASGKKEGDSCIMTATQLVALMDEEDAEDSRHEAEQLPTPHTTGGTPTSSPVTAVHRAHNLLAFDDEEEDEEVETRGATATRRESADGRDAKRKNNTEASRQRKRRQRSASSSSSLSSPPSSSATPPPPPSSSAPATHAHVAPPLETLPAALYIYLAPSVRRELLQGTCNSPGSGAPSTEVQRNTELQRILHFLTSAGATLISSLAQADNVAAQLGDKEVCTGGASSLAAGAGEGGATAKGQSERGSSVPMATAPGGGASAAATGGRRKTVGRVPLPRRSASTLSSAFLNALAHSPAAAPSEAYFVFLVVPPTQSAATSPSTGDTAGPVAADLPHGALPDVCVAHAFGVSAVHASWLWSVVPGALRVRLPTEKDQVELPSREDSCGSKSEPAMPPLRLTPFPSQQRWLSGRTVEFVERDDAMEMWLNAAGAVVTAEPLPPPPAAVTTAVDSTGRGEEADGPVVSVTAATAGNGARRRSVSLMRRPPRKQPRPETRPDFVYIRETAPAFAVDLQRLGSVPVLQMPWLVRGIEESYKARCGSAGAEGQLAVSADAVVSTALKMGVEALPLLSVVWEALQKTLPTAATRSRSRKERSRTPPHVEAPTDYPTPARSKTDKAAEAKKMVEENVEVPVTTAAKEASHYSGLAAPTATATDGNLRPFFMVSPDAKTPALQKGDAVPAGERQEAAATVASVDTTTLMQKAMGGDVGERYPTPTLRAGECTAPAAVGLCPTLSAPLVKPSVCAHPPIALGEDYYVSIAIPSTAALQSEQTHLPSSPSALPAVPATTVALGRVVDLQRCPYDSRQQSDNDARPCCLVGLQFYETKYVSMHVDPRSGEVVHQTTVYLSPQRATVAAAALLFDVPVYVITASARQHVYLLEEGDADVGATAPQELSHGWEQQQQTVKSTLTHVNADSAATPERTASQRYDRFTDASASPAPTSPPAHNTRGAARYRSDNPHNVANVKSAEQSSVLRALSPRKAITRAADDSEVANINGEGETIQTAAPKTVNASTDAVDVDDAVAQSTHTARHAVQSAHRSSMQQRSSTANASRAAQTLPQLSIKVSGRTVLLRPESTVTFYARHSLSLSQRAASEALRASSFSAHRADPPSGFPIDRSPARQQRTATNATSDTAPTNSECTSGDDSDSSQELIAEAPLLGQVELIREMDGAVDIVVHTAQPNSVFGGSKMYRIIPDMIVDASSP